MISITNDAYQLQNNQRIQESIQMRIQQLYQRMHLPRPEKQPKKIFLLH